MERRCLRATDEGGEDRQRIIPISSSEPTREIIDTSTGTSITSERSCAVIEHEMIGEIWDGEEQWGFIRVIPSFVLRARKRGGKVPALVTQTFRILPPDPVAPDRFDSLGLSDCIAVDQDLATQLERLREDEFHYLGRRMSTIWRDGADADRIRRDYFSESRQD